MMSRADLVWNRAALERGGKAPLAGDKHLVSLITLHGVLMNGGLEHVIETLTRAEYLAGMAAYRFLGMHAVASVLESALSGTSVDACEDEYTRLVPRDATIEAFYERTFVQSPELFSPL